MAMLSACASSSILAQAEPDSVHRRNECRLAAQVISTGNPAPRKDWALAVIRTCREGGAALARAISRARTNPDTAALNALTAPTVQLRDGAVFATALEIAGDRSASVEARVFAIRTLIWSMYPGGGINYPDLSGGSHRCLGYGPSLHTEVTQGAALPRDYVARAKSLARTLTENVTEAVPVRRAASCLGIVNPWPRLPS
jgi:hypothetical protein